MSRRNQRRQRQQQRDDDDWIEEDPYENPAPRLHDNSEFSRVFYAVFSELRKLNKDNVMSPYQGPSDNLVQDKLILVLPAGTRRRFNTSLATATSSVMTYTPVQATLTWFDTYLALFLAFSYVKLIYQIPITFFYSSLGQSMRLDLIEVTVEGKGKKRDLVGTFMPDNMEKLKAFLYEVASPTMRRRQSEDRIRFEMMKRFKIGEVFCENMNEFKMKILPMLNRKLAAMNAAFHCQFRNIVCLDLRGTSQIYPFISLGGRAANLDEEQAIAYYNDLENSSETVASIQTQELILDSALQSVANRRAIENAARTDHHEAIEDHYEDEPTFSLEFNNISYERAHEIEDYVRAGGPPANFIPPPPRHIPQQQAIAQPAPARAITHQPGAVAPQPSQPLALTHQPHSAAGATAATQMVQPLSEGQYADLLTRVEAANLVACCFESNLDKLQREGAPFKAINAMAKQYVKALEDFRELEGRMLIAQQARGIAPAVASDPPASHSQHLPVTFNTGDSVPPSAVPNQGARSKVDKKFQEMKDQERSREGEKKPFITPNVSASNETPVRDQNETDAAFITAGRQLFFDTVENGQNDENYEPADYLDAELFERIERLKLQPRPERDGSPPPSSRAASTPSGPNIVTVDDVGQDDQEDSKESPNDLPEDSPTLPPPASVSSTTSGDSVSQANAIISTAGSPNPPPSVADPTTVSAAAPAASSSSTTIVRPSFGFGGANSTNLTSSTQTTPTATISGATPADLPVCMAGVQTPVRPPVGVGGRQQLSQQRQQRRGLANMSFRPEVTMTPPRATATRQGDGGQFTQYREPQVDHSHSPSGVERAWSNSRSQQF